MNISLIGQEIKTMTFLIFAIASFVLLQVFGITSAAGEIALASVLGVIGTFVTQVIKRASGASGNAALFLTIVVSGVLGFIAAWSVGEWDSSDIIGSTGIVFSLATIAYKFLLSEDRVTETVNTAADNMAERIDGDGV